MINVVGKKSTKRTIISSDVGFAFDNYIVTVDFHNHDIDNPLPSSPPPRDHKELRVDQETRVNLVILVTGEPPVPPAPLATTELL